MFANNIVGKTPIAISLPVILAVLALSIVASLIKTRGMPPEPPSGTAVPEPEPLPSDDARPVDQEVSDDLSAPVSTSNGSRARRHDPPAAHGGEQKLR